MKKYFRLIGLLTSLLLTACGGGGDAGIGGGGKPSDESLIAAYAERLAKHPKLEMGGEVLVSGDFTRNGKSLSFLWAGKPSTVTITDVKITPVPDSTMKPFKGVIVVDAKIDATGESLTNYQMLEIMCISKYPSSSQWSAETKSWGGFTCAMGEL